MRTSIRKIQNECGIALLTTILILLLMSSLLVGFVMLLNSSQKLGGASDDRSRAFYGAEAGMEKMTADLGNLFDSTYAPTAAQLANVTANPPVIPGINYLKADGSSGYQLVPSAVDANGNPVATVQQIKSGAYQGMTALATQYTLDVNARTSSGSEVKLERTTQTVGIPMFQFGIFSDTDLSFFAGPNFNFGGRVHTNGNLFLAEGDGSTLTMSDRVTAVKDIIRTNLSNGWPTSTNYTGTVSITTSPGTSSYRAMAPTEGSLVGTIGSAANPNWPSISLGATNYAGNVRSGSTGATKLNLSIVTLGAGSTQAIDLIRRPAPNESAQVTSERYYAQASLRILLSDNPNDIMNLPCIDTSTAPFDLSQLAQPVAAWTGQALNLKTLMTANGTTPLPLAASGAAIGATAYNANDGYWLPYPTGATAGNPIIKGFIKIEAQTAYGTPCGTWKDVTQEILSLGYVGGNLDPLSSLASTQYGVPTTSKGVPLMGLPTSGQLAPNPCAAPHPNAIIRLERVRDNPSTWTSANKCGTVSIASPPSDFWPNVLFDTRQGTLRDVTPGNPYSSLPTLNGVTQYIELDAGNLAKWFAGTIGTTGPSTKDPNVAPNDFVVYISDRRGNYTASQTWAGIWPPLSPSGHETGEYGWNDFANPGNAGTGCPNDALDSGEDLDGTSQLYTYGANPTYIMAAGAALTSLGYGQYGTFTGLMGSALQANPTCAAPSYASPIWPMVYTTNSNAARENPPLFFRRAVKVDDGNNLTALGTCPGGNPCGLAIAVENPVYIQGDFNANSAGGGFNDPNVATSVAADAVTLLSGKWNDANSFSYNLYCISNPCSGQPRDGGTTFYRVAILAGKGVSFPQPAGTAQDFGTDGGVHNFLRYIENWNNQTLNYRGSIISMFYNRQGTGLYKCCTTVYSPPSRGYNFDVEFLQPNLLPPRTPLFRDVNTTGFTQLLLPNQ
jgi:Tfp pilus assembly protein PilX